MRIKEIAAVRVHYGYKADSRASQARRLRDQCIARLSVLQKRGPQPAQQFPAQASQPNRGKPHSEATAADECGAMVFVSDQLYDGNRFRVIKLIDLFTRECLGGLRGESDQGRGRLCSPPACFQRTAKRIKADNGPKVIFGAQDAWTFDRKSQPVFSRPASPTDNARIESFNGHLREECLNTNWLMFLENVKEKLNRWRNDSNEYRLHNALIYAYTETIIEFHKVMVKSSDHSAGPFLGFPPDVPTVEQSHCTVSNMSSSMITG